MESILEILKYVLPSLVVFATAYYIIKQFTDVENKRRMLELKNQQQAVAKNVIIPIQMQAYERLVLYLERISPSQLVLRNIHPTMNVKQLQTKLISNIREEFEHNLAQQMYVSSEAWELIKKGKDDVISVIGQCAAKLDANDNANVLAQEFIKTTLEIENPLYAVALEFLKREFRDTF